MEASEYLTTVAALHSEARRRGLFFQQTDDYPLNGRIIYINDQPLLSFGSCSYLGLEHHPALIAGVHQAVDRYGTQFSASRGYLSAPPYAELEHLLSELFGGAALVTPSTTLGHQIALSVLATEKDAIVLDHQVHHSVHMAATLARASGAHVELIRHGELDRALSVVERLARTHRTVWFGGDGVYSMYGDLAPISLLQKILDVAPNVRLYIDDAHGMSWAGQHGRGSFLSRMPQTDRIVVATSLNKAFAASGGCLIFPTEAEREQVRICGGPMVFSGPLQPPMLGAALASARLHLSADITEHQATLRDRTTFCNQLLRAAGLPLLVENEAPIFFIRLGLPRLAFEVAQRMQRDGMYMSVSAYPSVPMRRAGIRLSLTAHHTRDDIVRVVDGLARHIPAVLADEGVSNTDLDAFFAQSVPAESRPVADAPAVPAFTTIMTRLAPQPGAAQGATGAAAAIDLPWAELAVEQYATIDEVDPALWNQLLGSAAACSWDAMKVQELVYTGQPRPEHTWRFRYVIIRDAAGEPVAATFFTTTLQKDDMLMRASVSEAVEARRATDPYFLTSLVTMAGSVLSEGNHLYLNRAGPWQAAVAQLVALGHEESVRHDASVLVFRDFPADDPEMDALMLHHGLVKVPMLDSHLLNITWQDEAQYIQELSRKKRPYMLQNQERAGQFERRIYGGRRLTDVHLEPGELAHLQTLYQNVAMKNRRLNVFELPENLLPVLQHSPAWEIVTLHIPAEAGGPADGRPAVFYAAHKHDGHYAPFFCGLDYDYVFSHGSYRQMLYQIVRRAMELNMQVVHLGMGADMEKKRFGTTAVPQCIYVQAADHFNGQVLAEIAAEVGIQV